MQKEIERRCIRKSRSVENSLEANYCWNFYERFNACSLAFYGKSSAVFPSRSLTDEGGKMAVKIKYERERKRKEREDTVEREEKN